MTVAETIQIGRKTYQKFIFHPAPVTDGTVRCFACGQIDEAPWHDNRLCPAIAAPEKGIYVASRASLPERGQMWRNLRASGVKINSTWIDEDGPGETADFADLWPRIQREVTSSERLIAYLEPEDFPVRGVLVEIGMALGAGVPVQLVCPGLVCKGRSWRPLGSWIEHPLVSFADSVALALSIPLHKISEI